LKGLAAFTRTGAVLNRSEESRQLYGVLKIAATKVKRKTRPLIAADASRGTSCGPLARL
jgi:hypothetical protein